MKELSENEISLLVTPELFATYIGKTPSAIRKMASANKLPVVRMKDPDNPSKKGEKFIFIVANGMITQLTLRSLHRLSGITGKTAYLHLNQESLKSGLSEFLRRVKQQAIVKIIF